LRGRLLVTVALLLLLLLLLLLAQVLNCAPSALLLLLLLLGSLMGLLLLLAASWLHNPLLHDARNGAKFKAGDEARPRSSMLDHQCWDEQLGEAELS